MAVEDRFVAGRRSAMTAATMSVPSRQCRRSASFAAGNWHRLRSGAR